MPRRNSKQLGLRAFCTKTYRLSSSLMKFFRLFYRALVLVGCLIFHIVWVVVPGIFRGQDYNHALKTSRAWLPWALKMMGIRVTMNSKHPTGTYLYVGNHRSYIDGIIALSEVGSLPVVKAEVADWPLVGYGAKLTGIIFVKRDSKASRSATLEAMKKTLETGLSVLIYPEGTTHLEPTTIDFKPGSFVLAANNGFSLVPMAIDYEDINDSWVGDETFITHFFRCFGKKRCNVKLHFGQPIQSEDMQYLLLATKQWIDDQMRQIRQEFEHGKQAAAV